MALAYCLPKQQVSDFLRAVKDGRMDVFKLQDMTSVERRGAIADVIGEEHAREVNAQFEQKLLLKYKFGLLDWVQETANLTPEARENIADRISKIDERILNPADEKSFLNDLANERLGARVSMDEAKEIFDLTNRANGLKQAWQDTLDRKVGRRDVNNPDFKARVSYGNALLDLQDKIESLKPSGNTILGNILNVASMPKTVATGLLHFSAIGVQAWGMISKKVTWEAAYEQFRYFANEQNYRDLQAYIVSHPHYGLARDAGLGLTDVTDKLSTREEAIQSSYIQDANKYLADKTGLPINVFGASSRAFTGFLNYVRFNRFVDLVEAAERVDPGSVTKGSQLSKDLASVVNNFTGRANLDSTLVGANAATTDKYGGHNQAVLNAVFFAPRKVAATMQMFNPVEFGRLYYNAVKTGNYTAANAAVGQLVGSVIATGAVLYLANSMGYNVDYNPASQNFLKIVTPSGEKIDITGGNAIWTRFLGRMLMGKTIDTHGVEKEFNAGGYHPTTRAELAEQYIRGKLSSVAGFFADYMAGEDAVGRPFDVAQEARSRMEPIFLSSLLNYYTQQPDKAVSDIPVLSSLFGVAVESPTSLGSRQGVDVWGNPSHVWVDPTREAIDSELEKIGMKMKFPPPTINGIKLTDPQYKAYIVSAGALTKQRIGPVLQSPGFDNLPLARKQKVVKSLISHSQKIAQDNIAARSIGSENDIVVKSRKAKLEKQGFVQ